MQIGGLDAVEFTVLPLPDQKLFAADLLIEVKIADNGMECLAPQSLDDPLAIEGFRRLDGLFEALEAGVDLGARPPIGLLARYFCK